MRYTTCPLADTFALACHSKRVTIGLLLMLLLYLTIPYIFFTLNTQKCNFKQIISTQNHAYCLSFRSSQFHENAIMCLIVRWINRIKKNNNLGQSNILGIHFANASAITYIPRLFLLSEVLWRCRIELLATPLIRVDIPKLGYSVVVIRVLWLVFLAVLGPWINNLPPVCRYISWSTYSITSDPYAR